MPRAELAEAIAGVGGAAVGSDDGARHRLNTSLWRLRRALEPDGRTGPSVVVADRQGLAISAECDVWVDVEEFERACRPRVALPVERWTRQDADAVSAAVEAYPGELLVGCYDEWVLAERARLTTLQLSILTRLVAWHRRQGNLDDAVRFGDAVLAREPLREDVHRLLIGAYAAAGHRDGAMRQFERCRSVLAEELGIDPMPETLAAIARATHGAAAADDGAGRGSGSAVPGSAVVRSAVVEHGPAVDVGAVIRDLEAARSELARLGRLVDRSLDALRAHRL